MTILSSEELAQYSDEELVSRRETLGSYGPHPAGSNGRQMMDDITEELRQRRLARRMRPPKDRGELR